MKRWGMNTLGLALLALLLCACASTKLINSWRDSGYAGPPLSKILVIGVTKQSGIRRTFEDIFAEQLRAHHVEGIRGYTLIPDDGEVPQERLAQAVQASGAQGVLITRLVKVDRQTQYYPGTYVGPRLGGFYGYYSSAWIGFYDPPQYYTYDVVTSETSLFEAKANRLLWSGTSETFSPRDVKRDTSEFASVIIKALAEQGLVPGGGDK